jgi:hypothetical protein
MSFILPFDEEPDFVNELGVKWWKDETLTDYAQREDALGTALNAVCFYIEEPCGTKSRVLVSKGEEIMEVDQSLEGMAIKIDLRKFMQRDAENNK